MKKLLMILPLALISCFMVGCQDKEAMAELEAMKVQAEVEEQNEATIRRLLKEMDKGSVDIWDEVTSPDYVFHMPGNPEPLTVEDHKQTSRAFYAAFPDMYHRIEDIIAKGDRVIVRTTNRGTHKGEIMGVPPSGKEIVYSVIDICRFENGKIVEEWVEFDSLVLMQQLGMELKPKEGEK